MDEVLEKMYEETCSTISRDERELFTARIKRGQIIDHMKEHHQALQVWGDVLKELLVRVKAKKADVFTLRSSSSSDAESETSDESDIEDPEDNRQAKKRRHLRTKRGNELRDLLELQHRATFMMASVNFQLKNAQEETRLYEVAEALRQEVL